MRRQLVLPCDGPHPIEVAPFPNVSRTRPSAPRKTPRCRRTKSAPSFRPFDARPRRSAPPDRSPRRASAASSSESVGSFVSRMPSSRKRLTVTARRLIGRGRWIQLRRHHRRVRSGELRRLAEHRRPREEERHFHVEDDEQQRDHVEPQVELHEARADRRLAALVHLELLHVRQHRPQEPAEQQVRKQERTRNAEQARQTSA